MPTLNDWLTFLATSHAWVGLPMIIGGLGLMLFGWRLSRLMTALTLGGVAFGAGFYLSHDNPHQWYYAIGSGVAASALSFALGRFAVSLLAGLIAAAIGAKMLSAIGVRSSVFWIASAMVLVAAGALSAINTRQVAVMITAFQGAAVFMSGITAIIMAAPSVYGMFQGMAGGNYIVLPFILLVPAVMSFFYQLADIRRADSPT